MAQKIPFFELFHSIQLPWDLRLQLDGAYLTEAEVDRAARTMGMALTVSADLGEGKDALAAAVAETYQLKKVTIRQTVSAPAPANGGREKTEGGEVVMGAPIKGAVQPMAGLNPKMGSVVVAGKVFFRICMRRAAPVYSA